MLSRPKERLSIRYVTHVEQPKERLSIRCVTHLSLGRSVNTECQSTLAVQSKHTGVCPLQHRVQTAHFRFQPSRLILSLRLLQNTDRALRDHVACSMEVDNIGVGMPVGSVCVTGQGGMLCAC